MPRWNIQLTVDSNGVVTGMARGGRAVDGFTKRTTAADKATLALQRTLIRFAGPAALGLLARSIINTGRQFEQYRAQLLTVEGTHEAAALAMDRIKALATETPFQVRNLTEAYIQLRAKGVEPTGQTMREIGDLAAAFGKDIQTAQQAITQAMFGEAEMLKQFGIIMRQQGDSVKITFRGVTQEIKKDSDQIREALLAISRENFAGAMERQMETLNGAISNLGDATDALFDSLGRAGGEGGSIGLLAKAVRVLSGRINELTAVVEGNKSAWETWLGKAFPVLTLLAVGAGKVGDAKDSIAAFFGAMDPRKLAEAAGGVERIEAAAQGVGEAANEATAEMRKLALEASKKGLDAALAAAKDRLKEINEEYRDALEANRDWLEEQEDLERLLGDTLSVVSDMVTAMAQITPALRDAAEAAGDLMDELIKSGEFIPEDPFGSWQEAFKDLKRNLITIWGDLMAQMIRGAKVTGEQIGEALGSAIGAAAGFYYGGVAGAQAGAAIGGAIGGWFGGLFDSDDAARRAYLERIRQQEEETRRAAENTQQFIDSVLGSMQSRTLDLFRTIEQALKDSLASGNRFAEAMRAASIAMADLRNAILGIVPEGLGDRLRAATDFNANLIEMADQIRMLFSRDSPFGTRTGAGAISDQQLREMFELPEDFDLETFRQALAEDIQAALDMLPEAIDLSALTSQLINEFAGVTAALEVAGIEASADALREAILALEGTAMTSREVAAALERISQIERQRVDQVAYGVMLDILDIAERVGYREVETAQQRFEIERQILLIQVERFRLELEALGRLTDFWNDFLNGLAEAINQMEFTANSIASTLGSIGNVSVRGFGRRSGRRSALDSIRDFLQSLLGGGNALDPRSLQQQFSAAGSAFFQALQRARRGGRGAVQALRDLPGLAQTYLDLARRMFGSSSQYTAIFNTVTAALQQLTGQGRSQTSQTVAATHAVRDAVHSQTSTISAVTERQTGVLISMRAQLQTQASTLAAIERNQRTMANG